MIHQRISTHHKTTLSTVFNRYQRLIAQSFKNKLSIKSFNKLTRYQTLNILIG